MIKTTRANRSNTRDRMLQIAEKLMAERGIDGVSMRQLSAEIGGNTSALQYHFGDKPTLVREIIEQRLALLEPAQKKLWQEAQANDRLCDVRILLDIIFRPMMDARDENGRNVYAAFMLHFVTQTRYDLHFTHPGWANDSGAMKARLALWEIRPELDAIELDKRLAWLGHFFRGAVVERDKVRLMGEPTESDEAFLDNILNMMTAAFSAPLKDGPSERT